MSIQKQQNTNAIIVDPGSYECRIGMSIDPVPRYEISGQEYVKDGQIVKPDELVNKIVSLDLL